MVQVRGLHYNAVVIDFEKAFPLHKGIFYKLGSKVEMQKHLKRYPHVPPELVSGDSPQNVLTDINFIHLVIQ